MTKKIGFKLALIFIFLLSISALVIYFTFDINALKYLRMFKPECIGLAFGLLLIGLFFDGLRLIMLTNITGEKLPFRHVINVVMSNYFLALVTPGASGGAIAQVMFMRKAGVPITKSTVVVLVRTIFSIVFLMLLIPFILHLDPDIGEWMSPMVITFISVIFSIIPIVCFLLMHTDYPERWIKYCTHRMSFMTGKKCLIWYLEFKNACFVIAKHPFKVLIAFIESGLSLMFIYACVPAYFLGLDFHFNLIEVMGRMSLLNLVLYFTPTPGGSGVAEAGFVMLFSKIVPEGLAGIMAVLWRFTAEYVPFIIGGFFCIRSFGVDIMNMLGKEKKESCYDERV